MSLVGNAAGSVALALPDHGGPTDDALVVKHLGESSGLSREERREEREPLYSCGLKQDCRGCGREESSCYSPGPGRVGLRAERWREKGGRFFFFFF